MYLVLIKAPCDRMCLVEIAFQDYACNRFSGIVSRFVFEIPVGGLLFFLFLFIFRIV